MIWTIVGIITMIIGIILFRFFADLNKDDEDLQKKPLPDKFKVIMQMINASAFNGEGVLKMFSNREFVLHKDGLGEVIHFVYSTGNLTIIWKYTYYYKEVVHKHQFDNVRNLSLLEQQKIADLIIREMAIVVQQHKSHVITGMP